MKNPRPFGLPRRRRYPFRPATRPHDLEPLNGLPVRYRLDERGSMIVEYDLSAGR